jgi:hypothetical protein
MKVDLNRESVQELGRKAPYYRFANFPVEVTCEFEVMSTSGDWINAYEEGYTDQTNGFPINTEFYGNNTALLEKQFNWRGISIDLDERQVSTERSTPFLIKNALEIDYAKIIREMNLGPAVDYLQLDCDPAEVTFEILKKIPFDEYKFKVITFEHDHYNTDRKDLRELSREFLKSKGYTLVVNDIAPDEWRNYEDWWVCAEYISKDILNKMILINDAVKKGEDYVLSGRGQ